MAPAGQGCPLTKSVSPEGSYVITGGTGGIGLELALRLAQAGAGGVILLSRCVGFEVVTGSCLQRSSRAGCVKLASCPCALRILSNEVGDTNIQPVFFHAVCVCVLNPDADDTSAPGFQSCICLHLIFVWMYDIYKVGATSISFLFSWSTFDVFS